MTEDSVGHLFVPVAAKWLALWIDDDGAEDMLRCRGAL